ncbi:hypothetical protein A2U01_0010989 [Trifolium medium]|uniref:Uncharacterized protein n=1 Tax=Trifolium medium TaxID=97028 RepID=A0A392MS53_9FABA|nr:hypothetical protein [Trifolium medium]
MLVLCGLDWSFSAYEIEDDDFTVEQTALKVASSKVAKYEKTCSDNQHLRNHHD